METNHLNTKMVSETCEVAGVNWSHYFFFLEEQFL